jgi:hypothetical protein
MKVCRISVSVIGIMLIDFANGRPLKEDDRPGFWSRKDGVSLSKYQ